MNDYEAFEIIKKQLCKEVNQIAEQIQKTNSMSTDQMDKLDKLFHTKKNLLKSMEMEEDSEYMDSNMSGNNQNGNGMSGYRGRAMNGRYVSRSNGSYADGYNQGYSEAMNQMEGHSGHYPMMPYGPRRW